MPNYKHANGDIARMLIKGAYSLDRMDDRASRVAHAIKESGKNPAAVAQEIGCTPAAVYQWLSGTTTNIKNDLLFKLADATGFEARWIATGVGPERVTPKGDSIKSRLDELWPQLDDRGRTAVIRAAECESTYIVEESDKRLRSS